MRIAVSGAITSVLIMVIAHNAFAQTTFQIKPAHRNSPVSETAQPAPRVTIQCSPTKEGEALVFPYAVANEGPGDVYVADAFPEVDSATRTPTVDRSEVVIALQADGYALVLRGIPPPPPYPAAAPVDPLTHRLRSGERLERRLSVPLPLAETSPYQPYGNVRDYMLKPIEGVVLAVDWIAAGVPGFVAAPDIVAADLFTVRTPNLLQDMQRLTCRFPAKGLSILQRALNR